MTHENEKQGAVQAPSFVLQTHLEIGPGRFVPLARPIMKMLAPSRKPFGPTVSTLSRAPIAFRARRVIMLPTRDAHTGRGRSVPLPSVQRMPA